MSLQLKYTLSLSLDNENPNKGASQDASKQGISNEKIKNFLEAAPSAGRGHPVEGTPPPHTPLPRRLRRLDFAPTFNSRSTGDKKSTTSLPTS